MKKPMKCSVLLSLVVFTVSGFSPAYSGENEAAPERTILLEEFTSQGCGICPTSFRQIAEETADYNVVMIVYHHYDSMATDDTNEYVNKFTSSLPKFLVDRSLDHALTTYEVLSQVVKRAVLPPEMTIELKRAYDAVSRKVELDITLRALTDLEPPCLLYVIMKEDRLNYEQNYEGKKTYPYYHFDVVREFITGPKGELLSDATIEEGTVIQKTYSFTLNEVHVSDFCGFVVFVNRNIFDGYGPVLQAAETPLYGAEPLGVAAAKPADYILHTVYPNPFNPETTIEYTLPSACHVRLGVYDILGRLVTVLTDDDKSAGRYSAVWNGRDSDGNTLSSGVYFYQLNVGNTTEYGKMMLVR